MMIAEDRILQELFGLGKDHAAIAQRMCAVEKELRDVTGPMEELRDDMSKFAAGFDKRLAIVELQVSGVVHTVSEMLKDVRESAESLANIAGRLERSQVVVNAVGQAEQIRHEGMMGNMHIGGNVGGDVSGGNMNKVPTKWLIIGVITLIMAVAGIMGVRMIVKPTEIQVEQDIKKVDQK